MDFANESLAQAIGKVDGRRTRIELTLPNQIIEQVEQIVPVSDMYPQDVIYADLLYVGLAHLDELSVGDASALM